MYSAQCCSVVGLDVLAHGLFIIPVFYMPCFFHSRNFFDFCTVPKKSEVMNTGFKCQFHVWFWPDGTTREFTWQSSVSSVSVTSFRCKSWFVVSESDPFSSEHFGQETVLAVESSSPFWRPSVARPELARKYNPQSSSASMDTLTPEYEIDSLNQSCFPALSRTVCVLLQIFSPS